MAEPIYAILEQSCRIGAATVGTKISYHDLHNIPEHSGAVVALNHTSYIDWLPAALAAYHARRRLRFMIKREMKEVKIVNFLITGAKTIPVDRNAGIDAYNVAVERLQAGELVAVYPEATISRSFELKEFKSGAARMAGESGLPIVPMIVWGAQRRWTKDHPKQLGRARIPMSVYVGEPLQPEASIDQTNAVVRTAMAELLHRAQEEYTHPPGEWWVPRRLGGTAPTPDEARALDDAELLERARKQAEREQRSPR